MKKMYQTFLIHKGNTPDSKIIPISTLFPTEQEALNVFEEALKHDIPFGYTVLPVYVKD